MPDTQTKQWLPRFCSYLTLFAVMVVAELVVVVVLLAPSNEARPLWPRLGTASVFVQWLALTCVAILCSLRRFLEHLRRRIGMLIAWALMVVITLLGSAVVYAIDQALQLDLTLSAGFGARFVLGNTLICAFIAAALLRYLYVLSQWKEKVHATAKAQVEALQARIRPHFLFNSMNTIASLVRTRPAEAERTVEDLADLFRAALGADGKLGTLGEELDLLSNYLRIEQLRLGARLQVELDVDMLPRDFPLPRLLLQPLVENAVYHGIQRLAEGGKVRVHGRPCKGGIEIEVCNPNPIDSSTTRNGIALDNIRARIQYYFGAKGGLRVEPTRDLFTVTVYLPDENFNR